MDEQNLSIFCDLISHNHFATRSQIDECITLAKNKNEDVAQIMVSKGYLTPAKMKMIQNILAVDQTQSTLDPDQEEQLNLDLKLVEIKRLANDGQTDAAIKLMEQFKGKKYENLGQILTVKAFLAEERKKRLDQHHE
ncbi:MAG: hypothetical protein AABZ60_17495 [Planctomycetota bacterium]